MSAGLPSSLEEWNGADALLETIDIVRLRRDVDVVFEWIVGDDGDELDRLPEAAEAAIAGVIGTLGYASEHGSDLELLVAARLVKNVARPYLPKLDADQCQALQQLPD